MSGARRTYLYTLTLLALFCVARASAQQTQISWEEILAFQLSHARRLKSISMEYSYSHEPTEFYAGPEPYPYTVMMRYEMEGLKFREEFGLEGTVFSPEHVNHVGPSVRLYNTKHYQDFSTESAALQLQETPNANSYPWHTPTLQPYGFLFMAVSDRSLATVMDPEKWSERFERFELGEPVNLDGHVSIPVDAYFKDPETVGSALVRIYFAKDLDYYPIRHQKMSESGQVRVDFWVKSVHKAETSEGPVIIPLEAILSVTAFNGRNISSRTTYSVDEESLIVNEDIPDENFTFPLVLANTIYYKDGSGINMDRRGERNKMVRQVVAEALENLESPEENRPSLDQPGGVDETPTSGAGNEGITPAQSSSGLIYAIIFVAVIAVGTLGFMVLKRRI